MSVRQANKMQPQSCVCAAFLVFAFGKGDESGKQALCEWALGDDESFGCLLDSLVFLHEKRQDRIGTRDVAISVLSELCSQILLREGALFLQKEIQFVCEHPHRIEVQEHLISHPIFFRGNAMLLARIASSSILTVLSTLTKVDVMAKRLPQLRTIYDATEWQERIAEVVYSVLESTILARQRKEMLSVEAMRGLDLLLSSTKFLLKGAKLGSWSSPSEQVLANECQVATEQKLREFVCATILQTAPATNLRVTRCPFGDGLSLMIRSIWASNLRQILNSLDLMPSIEEGNPLLDQFLLKPKKKVARVQRMRSVTSPKIVSLVKKRSNWQEIGVAHCANIERLLVVQRIAWTLQNTCMPLSKGPFDFACFGEIVSAIARICDIYGSFLRNIDSDSVNNNNASTFAFTLCEAYLSYAQRLTDCCGTIISSSGEVHHVVTLGTQNTELSSLSLGEIFLFPLRVVLPGTVSSIERLDVGEVEGLKPLKKFIRSRKFKRVNILRLESMFHPSPSMVTVSSRLEFEEEIFIVHIEEDSMHCDPGLLCILSDPAGIVCGSKSRNTKETSLQLLFKSHKASVVDVADNVALHDAFILKLTGQEQYILKTKKKNKKDLVSAIKQRFH